LKKRIWWDLETTDLSANWGSILCIGYQCDGEKVKCISITDFPGWEKEPWNDRKVIEKFLLVLCREDVGIEITHFGTIFDIKFLQARMLYHKLGVFPVLGHVDTFFIAKAKLAVKGKSLGSLAEFAGCRYKKSPLAPEIWRRAGRGDRDALAYIVKHCIADVRVLRQLYTKLAPMMRRHPVMTSYGACHSCGKDSLKKRGTATTVYIGPRQRYQCSSCGAWTSRRMEA
jgi:uncharacterized protein YprB with RNaseH-like and TPR domain